MSWASVALAAYAAATGKPLTCAGCENVITDSSRPPEELNDGGHVHPNPRCYSAALLKGRS